MSEPEIPLQSTAKMADGGQKAPRGNQDSQSNGQHVDYEKISTEVAKILQPTIANTVELAITKAFTDLRNEVQEQAGILANTEQRMSIIEDDTASQLQQILELEQLTKKMAEKIDDLENRSRRSNLRLVGLPESYPASTLIQICQEKIPALLGITEPCWVERAHRVGPQRPDRSKSRQVIMKYLKYQDKQEILSRFKSKKKLELDGHTILLFADYSAEVTLKRKAFSDVCTKLYHSKIKFTLAYPAILKLSDTTGKQLTFLDPAEAKRYLDTQDLNNRMDGDDSNHSAPDLRPLPQRRQADTPNKKYKQKR